MALVKSAQVDGHVGDCDYSEGYCGDGREGGNGDGDGDG